VTIKVTVSHTVEKNNQAEGLGVSPVISENYNTQPVRRIKRKKYKDTK